MILWVRIFCLDVSLCPWRSKVGVISPGPELPYIGAGTWTRVLWESRQCSWRPSRQPEAPQFTVHAVYTSFCFVFRLHIHIIFESVCLSFLWFLLRSFFSLTLLPWKCWKLYRAHNNGHFFFFFGSSSQLFVNKFDVCLFKCIMEFLVPGGFEDHGCIVTLSWFLTTFILLLS